MHPGEAAVLAAAGLAAGFLNTLAGGGSALTIPALEWATGMPGVANATNRVAVLLQNIVGVTTFHAGKKVQWRMATLLSLPAVAGALLGAWLATRLPPGAMRAALSAGILFVALAALVKPPKTPHFGPTAKVVAFFLVGVYGGFLQVGVGFLLLACLAGGLGLDLVTANAAKVWIVLIFTLPAFVLFLVRGQVNLLAGLCLGAGNMTGAWIAARLAIRRGPGWIRYVVLAAALLAVTKLLFFPTSHPG